MTEDICKYIEKYILIELLCVIASHTITQPDHTTCTVWALHKPAVRWQDGIKDQCNMLDITLFAVYRSSMGNKKKLWLTLADKTAWNCNDKCWTIVWSKSRVHPILYSNLFGCLDTCVGLLVFEKFNSRLVFL